MSWRRLVNRLTGRADHDLERELRAHKDLKREFKYYRLTAAGRKQFVAEESKWKQMTGAIARIMWPAEEG
ncbi:MAG: hypothetical protein ACRD96_19195 [Bryobacteraceae bacterium]